MVDKANYIPMMWMLAFVVIVSAGGAVEDPTSKTWFFGIGMAVMIGGMGGHPHFVEFWANKDRLIRPTIRSTKHKYRKRVHHWWIDSLKEPLQYAEEHGIIKSVLDPFTREPTGESQMPVILKSPFTHPRYGKLWKVYVRWRGNWRDRMPQAGCKASRWGAYSFNHNTGDEAVFHEIPADEFHPDVPVREGSNYIFPAYRLHEGPGDIKLLEGAERQRKMKLLGMPIPR